MSPILFLPFAAATLAIAMVPVSSETQTGQSGRSGEQVVQFQCVLCHGPGLDGAPKIGDARAWGQRAHVGVEALVHSAARGRGGMPPSGGLSDLSESELRGAIIYMLRRSNVDIPD